MSERTANPQITVRIVKFLNILQAFNMLQRHRMLSQGTIFLKQNPGQSHMSVEELKEMLHSKRYSAVMSKLIHYAKNVTGSDAYWQKANDDLKAVISQVGPPTVLCHVQSITGQSFTIFLKIRLLRNYHPLKGNLMFSKILTFWIGFSLKELIVL